MTHPHPNRRFIPQAVLTRSGKINTADASVNTAVRPVNIVGSKTTVNHPRPISNVYKKGYSQVTRPFDQYSANKNSIFNKKVNIVRVKDTTARDTTIVSENKEKGVNVVKASACWVWKDKNSRTPKTQGDKEKKVNKVEKALYGLHQAPRAWYETLSTYLIENGFRRGTIDKNLFIKKDKGDILLVHVYVDDFIFGSTKKSLCDDFEGLMHKRFQMSSMGELTFFLGLQGGWNLY
ncbi:putative ribonuclease H-like domain-containing protein [Tanacetum coccineum]